MKRNFACRIIQPIIDSIIDDGCASTHAAPTEAPGVPSFALTARNAAIFLSISRPTTGGRPNDYEYRLRRRNAGDTDWVSPQPWIKTSGSATITITQYSSSIAIQNGQRYQVQVRALNDIGTGRVAAWQEVTPIAIPVFDESYYPSSIDIYKADTANYMFDMKGGIGNIPQGASVQVGFQPSVGSLPGATLIDGVFTVADTSTIPADSYATTMTVSVVRGTTAIDFADGDSQKRVTLNFVVHDGSETPPPQRQRSGLADERGFFLADEAGNTLIGEGNQSEETG